MNIKQMAKLIKYQFFCHKVYVKVKPKGTVNLDVNKRYIFNVRPESGTKVKRIFDCMPDIKACLECNLFEPFVENGKR